MQNSRRLKEAFDNCAELGFSTLYSLQYQDPEMEDCDDVPWLFRQTDKPLLEV